MPFNLCVAEHLTPQPSIEWSPGVDRMNATLTTSGRRSSSVSHLYSSWLAARTRHAPSRKLS
ncbi:MAG: hypothetical protein K0Q60_4572 [Microvirga sp.]|jgi:hypothetical protein|nr:hypothetical protein [Microvirga sp.]